MGQVLSCNSATLIYDLNMMKGSVESYLKGNLHSYQRITFKLQNIVFAITLVLIFSRRVSIVEKNKFQNRVFLFSNLLGTAILNNRPFYSCVLSHLAMNASEAGVDLALIQTSLFFSC